MPILKCRPVGFTRRPYRCDDCEKWKAARTPSVYLYGMAEVGDKPSPLRFCAPCAEKSTSTQEAARAALLRNASQPQ